MNLMIKIDKFLFVNNIEITIVRKIYCQRSLDLFKVKDFLNIHDSLKLHTEGFFH